MISKIHLRNVKGITGSFELGKITNIFGPNGSGKSAILEAIKIGLTGFTDLGKTAGKTFQHSSEETMEITLESDDGQTLTRRFEKSSTGAKQTISLNGKVISEKELILPESLSFPVESIHTGEFLNLSGDKRADFIFSALPSKFNSISPEQIEQKFSFFKTETNFSDLLSILKEKRSEKEKEIKLCLANIQKLTGEMGESPSGNLSEWEEKKKKACIDLEKIVSEISSNHEKSKLSGKKAEQIARLRKTISDADVKILNSEKKIQMLINSIKEIEHYKSSKELQIEINAISRKIAEESITKTDLEKKVKILNEKGCCPFCDALASNLENSIDSWELKIFNLSTSIDENKAIFADLDSKMQKATEAEKAEQQNVINSNSLKCEKEALKFYQEAQIKAQNELEEINSDNEETPVSIEILQGQADGLRIQISEAENNIKKFVAIQSVRNRKSESEKERMILENDLNSIEEAIKRVKSIRDEKLTSITKGLRKSFDIMVFEAFKKNAFLRLVNNEKPCFEFGFIRNNKEISFDTLSGGERSVMMAALVSCLQIVKSKKIGVGLFELAEADSSSFQGLIKGANEIGFEQVIVASCHGKSIENATNIDMGVEA
ncbi:MAG: AAA family ATPase [Candidatus Riflebacteria bacterium]|nr:AAA family ATPase [Candidatus Riflebacteria bacterium]